VLPLISEKEQLARTNRSLLDHKKFIKGLEFNNLDLLHRVQEANADIDRMQAHSKELEKQEVRLNKELMVQDVELSRLRLLAETVGLMIAGKPLADVAPLLKEHYTLWTKGV